MNIQKILINDMTCMGSCGKCGLGRQMESEASSTCRLNQLTPVSTNSIKGLENSRTNKS